jgi:hypothetical protein
VLSLALAAAACSKNKCKLDSADKKEQLGGIADMTQGAFSCDVEGAKKVGGMVDPSLQCDIGTSNCVATMDAIYPGGTNLKDVAAKSRAFLEKNKWTVTEKPISGSFVNGKTYEGVALTAKNGGKTAVVRVVPFGTDMVETRTIMADVETD